MLQIRFLLTRYSKLQGNIWVDGKRRIKRESFDKWYASQSKYTKVKEIEEVEGYVD